jgi:osmotically-inducible protein OsmY
MLFESVNVSANNGNVTLTGTVPTQDDKNSLEQKVRGMDGVQNVNNQVTVQHAARAGHRGH